MLIKMYISKKKIDVYFNIIAFLHKPMFVLFFKHTLRGDPQTSDD